MLCSSNCQGWRREKIAAGCGMIEFMTSKVWMNNDTMQALTFWKTITMDQSDFLEQIIAALEDNQVLYRVIGGQGVNAYVDPLVSLDLDLVIIAEQLNQVEALLEMSGFQLKRFPHSLNVALPGSSLRLQIQTDPRYSTFPQRTSQREVLGLTLPVAAVPDILQGKVWDFQDPTRRGSKRQKDLADIARLLERYPELRPEVTEDVLARLV
jgi:hypothetical protein